MSVRPPTLYPGFETIRQIQQIMLLAAMLSPTGKLAEVIRLALAIPDGPVTERIEPFVDLHPHAVKAWFERNWPPDEVSDQERDLISWQGDSEKMCAAIEELQYVEYRTGVRFIGTLATGE